MAKMTTIGRLYAQVKTANLADSPQPEREQIKCPNFGQLEPDVSPLELQVRSLLPVRRRFGRSRISSTPGPDLMSTCAPARALNRAADFQAMAIRAAAARWLARAGSAGPCRFSAPSG